MKSLIKFGAVALMALGLCAARGIAATLSFDLTMGSSVAFSPSNEYPGRALLDDVNGYLYMTADFPLNKLIQIRLSDFQRTQELQIPNLNGSTSASVIDTNHGFAYLGIITLIFPQPPAQILRADLSASQISGNITLNAGENFINSAFIDVANGFAYFTVYGVAGGTPHEIIKVRLSDFTRVATLTLAADDGAPGPSVIDTKAGYAYVATGGMFNGVFKAFKIAKIQLSDFTEVETLSVQGATLDSSAVAIDTTTETAYFAGTSSAVTPRPTIVRVRLSDFTQLPNLDTPQTYAIQTIVVDSANQMAYVNSEYTLWELRLSDFQFVRSFTFSDFSETLLPVGLYQQSIFFSHNNVTRGVIEAQLTPSNIGFPPAPSNVVATSGNQQVTISWSPVVGATSYTIYQSQTPGVSKNNCTYVDANNTGTSEVIKFLTNGTPYYYVVTASNADGESADSVQVSTTPAVPPPPPLAITSTNLPIGLLRESMSTALQASGGYPPYSWSISSDTVLPAGLLISTSGVISGIPTTIGTSTFTVQAQDTHGNIASQNESITTYGVTWISPADQSTFMIGSTITLSIAAQITPGQVQASPTWYDTDGHALPLNSTVVSNLNTGAYTFTAQWTNATVGTHTIGPAVQWSEPGQELSVLNGNSRSIQILPNNGPVNVNISPPLGTFHANESSVFTATVTGSTNTAVTWSLHPDSGTVSSTGLYQAPAVITSTLTINLQATSVADPTKFAFAQLTLIPPPLTLQLQRIAPGIVGVQPNDLSLALYVTGGAATSANTAHLEQCGGSGCLERDLATNLRVDGSLLATVPSIYLAQPGTFTITVNGASGSTLLDVRLVTISTDAADTGVDGATVTLHINNPSHISFYDVAYTSANQFQHTDTGFWPAGAISVRVFIPGLQADTNYIVLGELNSDRSFEPPLLSFPSGTNLHTSSVPGSPTQSLLPPPVLQLPSLMPIDADITLGIPAGISFVRYDWSITPAQQGSGIASHTLSIIAGTGSGSAAFSTQAPKANAATQGLVPGYYSVSVTGFDSKGNPSVPAQAFTTFVSADLSSVRVHPSPWRSDLHSGRDLNFDNLPAGSTVKIFTVSGHWVKTLSNVSGQTPWNLKNDDGDMVASGLYIYLVTDNQGNKAHGKFGVIR